MVFAEISRCMNTYTHSICMVKPKSTFIIFLGHNMFTNVPPFPSLQNENLRDKMLKSNKGDFNETKAKVDTDLDGKLVLK